LLFFFTALLSANADGMPLVKSAAQIGATCFYDPLTGTGVIERSGFRVSFKTGFPYFMFDKNILRKLDPIFVSEGSLISPDTTIKAIDAWLVEHETELKSRFRIAAILIDPGHGGKDPGAMGEFKSGGKTVRVVEKDVSFTVSKRIFEKLRTKYPDRTIMLSRTGDTYPTLEERVDKANSIDLGPREAIIYISIHANASFNKNASGFEVWYLNPDYRRPVVDPKKNPGVDPTVLPILNVMMEEEFTTESILLAQRISSKLGDSVGSVSKNRGVKAEEWFVVRNAKMPSVLVEVGFVTDAEEAALLSNPAHLSKIADAVYNGVVDFIDHFENRGGSPAP
jgi:N-acetylmuramoyl-L-alanine amidase